MIHADLRGKLADRNREQLEDILTSNVFSFFQYADRSIFLHALLRSWDLDVTTQEAQEAEFHFWPQLADGTEPDLVVLVGRYYVLFEAKYRSGFGLATTSSKDQLTREAAGGTEEARTMGKVFRLVVVTAHHLRAGALAEMPESVLPGLWWTNWQQIGQLVQHTLATNPPLSTDTRSFAEDLCELLVSKGLRGYAGLTLIEHGGPRIKPATEVFFSARTASYRGAFLGFVASLALESRLARLPPRIFFAQGEAPFASLRERARTLNQLDGSLFFPPRHHFFGSLKSEGGLIDPLAEIIFRRPRE